MQPPKGLKRVVALVEGAAKEEPRKKVPEGRLFAKPAPINVKTEPQNTAGNDIFPDTSVQKCKCCFQDVKLHTTAYFRVELKNSGIQN